MNWVKCWVLPGGTPAPTRGRALCPLVTVGPTITCRAATDRGVGGGEGLRGGPGGKASLLGPPARSPEGRDGGDEYDFDGLRPGVDPGRLGDTPQTAGSRIATPNKEPTG